MVSPVIFLRQTYDELKKVTWPTQEDIIRLTVVVVVASMLVGLYIGGLDYVFTTALQRISQH